MSKELNLRVLNDIDLGLLREACKKHKERAPEFYGWFDDSLRREYTRRLLIDSDQLPGAPVTLHLPTLQCPDAKEAILEVSRLGQFYLAMAKQHPEDEQFLPTSVLFANITLQLLAGIQEAQARN